MREIQIAQNKTLKLTNVLARKIEAEEFANLQIVLTQMQNFMKSNNAQPIGPMIQCVKIPGGPNPQPEVYMMQQTTLHPGRCSPRARLPVRPLHRPHEPERPCQPEAEHLCL